MGGNLPKAGEAADLAHTLRRNIRIGSTDKILTDQLHGLR